MDSAFYVSDNVSYLMSIGQPFIIAGAGARLPLVTAIVQAHLLMDHHLVLRDRHGLLYSYTLLSVEGMSETSMAQLKPKVAISNAFRVGNRPACLSVSDASRRASDHLAPIPDQCY